MEPRKLVSIGVVMQQHQSKAIGRRPLRRCARKSTLVPRLTNRRAARGQSKRCGLQHCKYVCSYLYQCEFILWRGDLCAMMRWHFGIAIGCSNIMLFAVWTSDAKRRAFICCSAAGPPMLRSCSTRASFLSLRR